MKKIYFFFYVIKIMLFCFFFKPKQKQKTYSTLYFIFFLLECLLHEMESLAYSGDYAAAAHVVESVQLRNTKPNLEVQPHLGRRHFLINCPHDE